MKPEKLLDQKSTIIKCIKLKKQSDRFVKVKKAEKQY